MILKGMDYCRTGPQLLRTLRKSSAGGSSFCVCGHLLLFMLFYKFNLCARFPTFRVTSLSSDKPFDDVCYSPKPVASRYGIDHRGVHSGY
ncbi:MAG: hypothetical protein C4522_09590 [Desulfobacteraceae bacterium]|nr:MAG: hypothetical protein C4522_09590 [Desulfobacteraceae bacterium]